jgi:hypothetical protein
MAERAASKSNDISGFMGAYVIGVLCAKGKPDFAIKQFRKGRKAGHIPSRFFEHQLRSKRTPLIGATIGLFFRLADIFAFFCAAAAKDTRRLWRGADMFRSKNAFLDLIGPDRKAPFSRIAPLVPIAAAPPTRPTKTDEPGSQVNVSRRRGVHRLKWAVAALTLMTMPLAIWLSGQDPKLRLMNIWIVLGFLPLGAALVIELRAQWKRVGKEPNSDMESSRIGNKVAAVLAVVLASMGVLAIYSFLTQ